MSFEKMMCYPSQERLNINRPGWRGAVGHLIFIPPHPSNQQSPICTRQSWNPGQGIWVLVSPSDQWVPPITRQGGLGSHRQQPGVCSQARAGSLWKLAIRIGTSSKIEIKHAGWSFEAAAQAPQDVPFPSFVHMQLKWVLPTELGGAGFPCAAGLPTWRQVREQNNWRHQDKGREKPRNQLYAS